MRSEVMYPTHSLDTGNWNHPAHPKLTVYITSSEHDHSIVLLTAFGTVQGDSSPSTDCCWKDPPLPGKAPGEDWCPKSLWILPVVLSCPPSPSPRILDCCMWSLSNSNQAPTLKELLKPTFQFSINSDLASFLCDGRCSSFRCKQ